MARTPLPGTGTGFRLRLLAQDPYGAGDGAISPDGRSFVASSRRAGPLNLWIFDIPSGRWRQGTYGAGEDMEAQWSPDGRRLAFTSARSGRKSIWLWDLEREEFRQLTDATVEDEYPTWSPDGRTIAYTGGAWGDRYFYLVPAEGGPPRRVSRTAGRAGACSFAPDGRTLVCHSYDTGAGAIHLLGLDGEARGAVTDGSAWDYKPSMSPDGRWVAYSRSQEGPSQIWVQRVGEASGRPLATVAADDRWPMWTGDGNGIFFHRLVDEGAAIMVWDRGTGVVRRVVGEEERPRFASFDPRGRRLVYCAASRAGPRLRIRGLPGGPAVTLPVGQAAFPRWSPDGRQLAFVRRSGPGARWEVATYDLVTGSLRTWTEGYPRLKGMHGPVDWSPDGQRLVFKTDTEPFEANLCVLDLRTGLVAELTADPWWDEMPAWSPDGRSVVFMSTRGGEWTWGLFRRRLDTGGLETLAGPDYVEKNDPRPVGDGSVLWTADRDGVQMLYELDPAGRGRFVEEAGTDVRYPVASADGRFVAFTRIRRHVEYWLAENVWAADSPLLRPPEGVPAEGPRRGSAHPPTGPVRSPVDTRRR